MAKLFPLDTGTNEIRGIITIIRENGGRMEMSALSRETNDDIDDLFPLIDSCSMLGFCTISRGIIKLTESGGRLASSNYAAAKPLFAKALQKVEPFRSTLLLLSRSDLSTDELASRLSGKGISFHSDPITNNKLLKNLLLKWAVMNYLLHYNVEMDVWSRYKASP